MFTLQSIHQCMCISMKEQANEAVSLDVRSCTYTIYQEAIEKIEKKNSYRRSSLKLYMQKLVL